MEKIVEITNRNNGFTGYTIPDQGIVRNFAPKETKRIKLDELKSLSYVPGGEYLLKNYFIINNTDALATLNLEVEPEYFYTEEEIEEILTNGTLDQLEDTLNFAPNGVIEMIKAIAVESELPDTRKRKLILEKTNFNVNTAIEINNMMNEETTAEEKGGSEVKVRKTEPKTSTTTRKAAAPTISSTDKYKNVKIL